MGNIYLTRTSNNKSSTALGGNFPTLGTESIKYFYFMLLFFSKFMLNKLIEIVKKKYQIDKTQEWYKWPKTYFDWLIDETQEVEVELKKNNKVYLEDELWDILWVYLNMLEWLKDEGKIDSLESVLQRAEKKFWERIEAINGWKTQKIRSAAWKRVKNKQKAENKVEHNKLYNQ